MQTAFRINLTNEQREEMLAKVQLNCLPGQTFYMCADPSIAYSTMHVELVTGIHAEILRECLQQAKERMKKTGPLAEPKNDKWTCIGRYVEDNEPYVQHFNLPTASDAMEAAETSGAEIWAVIAGHHNDAMLAEMQEKGQVPQ